jgi:hypothetical protein
VWKEAVRIFKERLRQYGYSHDVIESVQEDILRKTSQESNVPCKDEIYGVKRQEVSISALMIFFNTSLRIRL